MRSLLIAALLLHAASARANECNAYSPHASTASVPIGCPLVIAVPQGYVFTAQVMVTRYDVHTGLPTTTDVTGDATKDPSIMLQVETYRYDGTCELHDDGPQPQPYDKYEVALHDVQVGDVLSYGSYDGAQPQIVAAGACPDFAAPELSCADPIQGGCDPADGADAGFDPLPTPKPDGGCSTTGSGGLGIALALLALRRRR